MLITSKQVITILKPELPSIKALIEQRDRTTGEVALPEGIMARLIAAQEGAPGTKHGRGKALRFSREAVELVLEGLKKRNARLLAPAPVMPVALNALAEVAATSKYKAVQRSLGRIAAQFGRQ